MQKVFLVENCSWIKTNKQGNHPHTCSSSSHGRDFVQPKAAISFSCLLSAAAQLQFPSTDSLKLPTKTVSSDAWDVGHGQQVVLSILLLILWMVRLEGFCQHSAQGRAGFLQGSAPAHPGKKAARERKGHWDTEEHLHGSERRSLNCLNLSLNLEHRY